MARSRHAGNTFVRPTHEGSPIDFGAPSLPLYSSQVDIEPIATIDLGRGSVTDGAIAPGGLDGNTLLRPGTVPPTSFDITPPAVPTGLVLSSVTGPDKDGRSILKLIATVIQPVDTDLFATYVDITAENDLAVPPLPIWNNPATLLIGKGSVNGAIEGVRGLTQYWARARSVDVQGNYSAYTAAVSFTTAKDNVAPGMPQDFVAAAGFKGVGVHWAATQAADLMFFEVWYAPDNGGGIVPQTDLSKTIRVRTNTVWIDNLTIGQKYWFMVRAVDFSGNVVTSAAVSTAVDYLQNSDAGWTAQVAATPIAVGASDVAFNSVLTNILAANYIDASAIKVGIMKVSVGGTGTADGIEIWNAAGTIRLCAWNETGLYIGTLATGLPVDLSGSDYVRITDAGLTVYLAGVATTAITPNGINATAVNFGALPGGHNLLLNSSFELADFAAAPTSNTWDVAANWTATQVSATNVTVGAGALTQTASTY